MVTVPAVLVGIVAAIVVLLVVFLAYAVYMSAVVGASVREQSYHHGGHDARHPDDPIDRDFERAKRAMQDTADQYRRRDAA